MKSVNVTSKGLDGILRNLKKFGDDAQSMGEKAVLDASKDVVKSKLEQNTPYDPESTNPSHLRDQVVVRSRKTKNRGYKYAFVTYSGSGQGKDNPVDVRWRAGFVEWGTVSQKPQGMVSKTAVQVKGEVEGELANRLRRLL